MRRSPTSAWYKPTWVRNSSPEPVLRVQDLEVHRDEAKIIKGVSLEVADGSVVAVLGPNGAGKSTLVNTISGTNSATHGEIFLMGEPIHHMASYDIIRRGISLVPEGRLLFRDLTVFENLKVGSYSSSRARKELRSNLEMVFGYFPKLRGMQDRVAKTLSGGEQQMLAIGRSLMSMPKLLILDEPMLGLAPLVANSIFTSLRSICQRGLSVLLVEQNLRATLRFVDQAYVMDAGKIVAHGTEQALLSSDISMKYFGLASA